MSAIRRNGSSFTTLMRWTARTLGLLVSGLFGLFVIFEGSEICSALSWTSPQGMPLFVVLTLAAGGVLVAWRKEMLGGAMAVMGAIAINTLVYLGAGRERLSTSLMISLPLFVAGILFVVCCRRTRPTTLAV